MVFYNNDECEVFIYLFENEESSIKGSDTFKST